MTRILPLLVLCSALSARAQEPEVKNKVAVVNAAHRKLVEQLGDPSFASRDKAARKLDGLGLAAKPALLEGMKHADLEIRLAAHQILSRAMRAEFDRLLTKFIEGEAEAEDGPFPAWERMRRLVGDSRATRRLYGAMLRREAALLEALDDASDVANLYATRTNELRMQLRGRGLNNEPPHPASAASLLLVAAETKTSTSYAHAYLYSLLRDSSMKQSIEGGEHASAIRRMLDRWVLRQGTSADNYYGIMLALSYDLNDTCLKIGRALLDDPSASYRLVQYGAIAVGKFGEGAEDIARLKKHIGNKRVCHTWSNSRLKKNGVIEIQIRDIVLVMLLHLTEQDPKKYGFKLLQENEATMYHIYTFGFIENKERAAAFAKWKTKGPEIQNPKP